MTDDFVTRLGVALRDAADREERRRAPWRALATARATLPRLRPSPVARHADRRARARGRRLRPGQLRAATTGAGRARRSSRAWRRRAGSTRSSPAFGSAWLADTDTQTLLRMDPATRRVTARFPLGGSMDVTPGKGAMWVGLTQNSQFRLLRIDPRTNRIVARLRTPDVPGGSTGSLPVMVGDNLWLLSAEAAVRIDPANGHAIATVHTARDGYQTRSFAVVDGDLWVHISDGRLLRLDGATGRRKATFHVPDGSLVGDFGMNGLFVVDQATLSRVDPRNLHVLWRTPIPSIGPGSRRTAGCGSRRPAAAATAS